MPVSWMRRGHVADDGLPQPSCDPGAQQDTFASEEQDLGKPVLGAGTLWAITKEGDAAHGWMEFLQTPIAHEIWMAQSGFLTPFKGANPDVYATDVLRDLGEILTNATTFRFDASDLMPGEIGAGAFWSGMVEYTTGADAATVAGQIQERWESID